MCPNKMVFKTMLIKPPQVETLFLKKRQLPPGLQQQQPQGPLQQQHQKPQQHLMLNHNQ